MMTLDNLNKSDLDFTYGLSRIDPSYYNLSTLKLSLSNRLNDIDAVRAKNLVTSSFGYK